MPTPLETRQQRRKNNKKKRKGAKIFENPMNERRDRLKFVADMVKVVSWVLFKSRRSSLPWIDVSVCLLRARLLTAVGKAVRVQSTERKACRLWRCRPDHFSRQFFLYPSFCAVRNQYEREKKGERNDLKKPSHFLAIIEHKTRKHLENRMASVHNLLIPTRVTPSPLPITLYILSLDESHWIAPQFLPLPAMFSWALAEDARFRITQGHDVDDEINRGKLKKAHDLFYAKVIATISTHQSTCMCVRALVSSKATSGYSIGRTVRARDSNFRKEGGGHWREMKSYR